MSLWMSTWYKGTILNPPSVYYSLKHKQLKHKFPKVQGLTPFAQTIISYRHSLGMHIKTQKRCLNQYISL